MGTVSHGKEVSTIAGRFVLISEVSLLLGVNVRAEAEVFADLRDLCSEPGYVHAMAFSCFRDDLISFRREVKAKDMQHMFPLVVCSELKFPCLPVSWFKVRSITQFQVPR